MAKMLVILCIRWNHLCTHKNIYMNSALITSCFFCYVGVALFLSLCYHNISWWHLQLKWQLKIYQRIIYWIKYMILGKRKKNQEIIACKVWYLWCYLWQGFWWNKSQISNDGDYWGCLNSNGPYFALW